MMPQRIQLRRVKGWRLPENTLVVARPTKWGNPFRIDEYGIDLAVALYGQMARGLWNPTLLSHLSEQAYMRAYETRRTWLKRLGWPHPVEAIRCELRGHDLACWCPLSQPCHADTLLEVAR
jgi:Domain of unknown function (DUF4326)